MRQKFIKIGSFLVMTAAVIFTAFSTTSCGDPDNNNPDNDVPALTIDISSKDIVADGEEFVFEITSANISWTVTTSEPTWTEIDKSAGEGNATVTVTVLKNETTSQRTATVTIKATGNADLNKTLIITQAAGVQVDPPASFADSLEGDWTVSYFMIGLEPGTVYQESNPFTITKISDTQVLCEGLFGAISDTTGPEDWDPSFNIAVNDDNTISIDTIQVNAEGTYWVPYIDADLIPDNLMKSWEHLPVVDGVVEFKGYPIESPDGSIAHYGSWIPCAVIDGAIYGFGWQIVDMVWEKGAN